MLRLRRDTDLVRTDVKAGKFAGLSILLRRATRIRDRAIRRAGELLKQIDGQGRRRDKLTKGSDSKLTQNEVAREAGMSKHQQVTAVRVAVILTSMRPHRRPQFGKRRL